MSVHGEPSLPVSFKLNLGGGVGHQDVKEVSYHEDDEAYLLSSDGESSASHVHVSEHSGNVAFIRVDDALFWHDDYAYLCVPPSLEVSEAGVEATGPGVLVHEYVIGLESEESYDEEGTRELECLVRC